MFLSHKTVLYKKKPGRNWKKMPDKVWDDFKVGLKNNEIFDSVWLLEFNNLIELTVSILIWVNGL